MQFNSMPHPAWNPGHYSESATHWACPHCPKVCKSKCGRLQHIWQKHHNDGLGNLSFNNLELECSLGSESLVLSETVRTPQLSPDIFQGASDKIHLPELINLTDSVWSHSAIFMIYHSPESRSSTGLRLGPHSWWCSDGWSPGLWDCFTIPPFRLISIRLIPAG